MLISIIYFERSFYCIVEEIEEQLHEKRYEIELPDFSQRGACYHVKSYSMSDTGGLVALLLWHGESSEDANAHNDDGATNKVGGREQRRGRWGRSKKLCKKQNPHTQNCV